MKIIIQILFIFLTLPGILTGQEKFRSTEKSNTNNQILNTVFDDIEVAIKNGDASRLSKHLGAQTYFSLSNGVNGYYSVNQAYYILEEYFNIFKVASFKFKQISKSLTNPYATGLLAYENKGVRNTAKVYISLKKIGDKWNITQITIN